MRTFFLEKQDIIRITGQRFYKRGYDYFQKGRVYGLSYNPAINMWTGNVRGTEIYSVRIFFFDNDDQPEASCGCPAYETHYTCKHIAAVLLAIGKNARNNGSDGEMDPNLSPAIPIDDTFSSRIIEAFSPNRTSLPVAKQKPLMIEYILKKRVNHHNSKSLLEIELKVGEKKPLVIKDIRGFLSSVKKEISYKITSSFTYQPATHYFTEEDHLIISQLIVAYENESMFDHSFANPQQDKRALLLPPGKINALLPLLAEQEASYHISSENTHVPVSIINEQAPPLKFQLDMDENDTYYFDVTSLREYSYFESYGLLFSDGNFYQLTNDQQKIIDQLYALLPYRTRHAHPIAAENIQSFFHRVLPKLEKIGGVTYSESVRNRIIDVQLHPKIYLDEQQSKIIARVEFHYDDRVVLPYQKNRNAELIVKRDVDKEEMVLNSLGAANFAYKRGQFQLQRQEDIYFFLHNGLAELEKAAEVYVSYGVKAMLTNAAPVLKSSVNVEESSGMLDIQFDMEGIAPESIQHILQAMVEKKSYYRIPNGALLNLEEQEFESLRHLTESLQLKKDQVTDDHIHVPVARSFQVEEALTDNHVHYESSFENLLTQLKHPQQRTYELPETLDAQLRDYQFTGFQWLKSLSHYHLGGILADDMGLGKTLQTIAYLLSEKADKPYSLSSLIVVPSSLLFNWKKEFEKFAPTIKTCIVNGTKEQRRNLLRENQEAEVYITSYPLIRRDADLYTQADFDTLILDEAQAIKNHLTQTAKAVRSVRASNRFALSGTPIENSLEELWSIFQTISPGLFGNKQSFLDLDNNYISRISRPFILRRIKKEVLEELPDKIETNQYSELTKDQKEVYLAYLEKMQSQLNETVESKGFEKGKLEILAGLTRLRQVCCHPSLFLENYEGQSGKLEQLNELVTELSRNNQRALIFSQFASMLPIIEQKLHENGINTFLLDGSTPSEQRMEMVERFNAGEKTIFLISLKAGGTGLNLTGADTVILYDLWWNPAVEEQAAGRAHRIGQKKVVQVIRMITEGTIEEKIFQLQQRKRQLVDQIIQPGETMLTKLSEDEIRELLEMNVNESANRS